MDTITQQRIALLHPSLRDEVTALVLKAGAALTGNTKMRIVQGLRTFPEQDALYAQRPKVTNAKGGQSYHNYGLAIDFCLIVDGKTVSWNTKSDSDNDHIADWEEVIMIFEAAGWKSGRAFNDLPHFEKSAMHWKELLKKYQAGDFIPGTKYLNL